MKTAILGCCLAMLPIGSAAAERPDPVRREILQAEAEGALSAEQSLAYRQVYLSAQATHRKLRGFRRRELGDVIANLRRMASAGLLNTTRMPAAFLILRRNREWWSQRPRPAAFARVSFPPSRLVFEYYPGHGLQIQPLANFSTANRYFFKRTPEANQALGALLDELSAIASIRHGFLTWEYFFPYRRGRPPWTSAISQGTAIQAYSRAAVRLSRTDFFETARAALGAFQAATPVGVRVRTGEGEAWYAIYSFEPGLRVLNAHAQALNGLFDFGKFANDDGGRLLYLEGLAALRGRIASFDTGAWSKYAQPGIEANLNYHRLNGDLTTALCERSAEPSICRVAGNFRRYLTEPPRIGVPTTGRPRRNRLTSVVFFVSKVGRFSVYVKRHGRVVRAASRFGYRGLHRLRFRAPARPGPYRLDVQARDLAGNTADRRGTLRVR